MWLVDKIIFVEIKKYIYIIKLNWTGIYPKFIYPLGMEIIMIRI
jgi:hypothetical protein